MTSLSAGSSAESQHGSPLYSVQLATVGHQMVPGSEIYYLRDFDDWQPLWFTMAILRSAEHLIVVNTGFGLDFSPYEEAWLDWHPRGTSGRRDDELADAIMERLGIDSAAVTHVVLSPLGGYATGRIDLFRNAEICVARAGWERLMSPRQDRFEHTPAQAFPREQLEYVLFEAWDRLRLLDDVDEVAPGIRSVRTQAHAPGSLALFIPTRRGIACYSDSFFTFRNVEENIPLGIARSLDDSVAANRLARSEADIVLPAYDPELFTRYPDGVVA